MILRFLLLYVLIGLFACNSDEPSEAEKSEETRIRATFKEYKIAVQEKDGKKAVSLLDSGTLNYYGELLQQIRSADSASIATFRLTDKVTLLTLRHRLSAREIWTFDKAALLAYAVKEGLLGRDAEEIPDLDIVEVKGSWAEAKIEAKGGARAIDFYFSKEEEAWKLSLLNIFNMSDQMFQKAVANSGLDEQEFLRLALEQMHGGALKADIFNPVPQP